MTRYDHVSPEKAAGITYTPPRLARFIAQRLVAAWQSHADDLTRSSRPLRALDPAVGEGALLRALHDALRHEASSLEATGHFIGVDADSQALQITRESFDEVGALELLHGDLFALAPTLPDVDLMIANPPYVRTQLMDAAQVQALQARFGLRGHLDLCHAFTLQLLELACDAPHGALVALILPNSVLRSRAARELRHTLIARATLLEVWDLGDSRLFDAAVLPVVLLFSTREAEATLAPPVRFESLYARAEEATVQEQVFDHPIAALEHAEAHPDTALTHFTVSDGRRFTRRSGTLRVGDGEVWQLDDARAARLRAAVAASCAWRLDEVASLHVGIKSCADAVFIRESWQDRGVEEALLFPLSTHHVARPFAPLPSARRVLYPHYSDASGRCRPVDLSHHPGALAYLSQHRERLEGRRYLARVKRQWYEHWVTQDPALWARDKIVWRDIAPEPTFWLDRSGSVVNGDCYWLTLREGAPEAFTWLVLGVCNSSFARVFYDVTSGQRLYGARRRYMAQYVARFPLPALDTPHSQRVVALARLLHDDPARLTELKPALDAAVWACWGLDADLGEE